MNIDNMVSMLVNVLLLLVAVGGCLVTLSTGIAAPIQG